MARKSFFEERTPAQIGKLTLHDVSSPRGLTQKILDLDSSKESIRLNFPIIPGNYFRGDLTANQAGKKAYKHGNYLALNQPTTIKEALNATKLPHELRRESFEGICDIPEHELHLLGYSFTPIQGPDKRKRLVPFPWIFEGARIYAYALQNAGGIETKFYDDSAKVSSEGATIVAKVPSREDKANRYTVNVSHIPMIDVPAKNAIWPGISTTYAEGKMPEHSRYSFRFRGKDDSRSSDYLILYPQDIAATYAISHRALLEGNRVPWDMNPFAKPSEKAADFYLKLCNNTLIRDPSTKQSIRKLHVPEKAILLARLIGHEGHDNVLMWQKGRDSKISEYDWGIRTA